MSEMDSSTKLPGHRIQNLVGRDHPQIEPRMLEYRCLGICAYIVLAEYAPMYVLIARYTKSHSPAVEKAPPPFRGRREGVRIQPNPHANADLTVNILGTVELRCHHPPYWLHILINLSSIVVDNVHHHQAS